MAYSMAGSDQPIDDACGESNARHDGGGDGGGDSSLREMGRWADGK